jgi:4-hydroxybenzoate polyprenyltransferase
MIKKRDSENGDSAKILTAGVVFLVFAALASIFLVFPILNGFFSHPFSLVLAFFLWLFFLSFVLISLLVHLANRLILPTLWRNLRPFRTIHFILMVIIGLVISGNIDYLAVNNVPFIIIAVLLLVFIWQYTVMINDIYDVEIDRFSNIGRPLIAGVVTKGQYANLMYSFAAFSVIFGFILGPLILALALFCLFLGTVYSVPPFRVRDRIWSSVIIGSGSACAFLIGFFTPNYLGIASAVSMDAILIALIIFSALSMGPVLTDLKDYEGDRRANVKTLYTVFGLEEGKRIASTFIPVMFIIPTLILNNIFDIAIFVIFGALATIIFYKKGDFRGVFLCYFIVIIYCILRITGTFSGTI